MANKRKKSQRKSPRAKQQKAIKAPSPTNNGRNDRIDNVERITSRASAFGSTLVHLGVVWGICAGLLALSRAAHHNHDASSNIVLDGYVIPQETLSAWTEYPNPLNITNEDRANFHPVVKFPKVWMEVDVDATNENADGDRGTSNNNDETSSSNKKKQKRQKVDNYKILDHTTSSATAQLATEEERQLRKTNSKSERRVAPPAADDYSVGRYDENRAGLYKSELFDDTSNDIDGFAGARTVHIGIDLDGPIGTKVHAFADGVVHSAGYNAELGDYGNVIVLEHDLGSDQDGKPRKVWALYGHLDDKSIVGKKRGKKIRKGQVIGRFGDIHENGGW